MMYALVPLPSPDGYEEEREVDGEGISSHGGDGQGGRRRARTASSSLLIDPPLCLATEVAAEVEAIAHHSPLGEGRRALWRASLALRAICLCLVGGDQSQVIDRLWRVVGKWEAGLIHGPQLYKLRAAILGLCEAICRLPCSAESGLLGFSTRQPPSPHISSPPLPTPPHFSDGLLSPSPFSAIIPDTAIPSSPSISSPISSPPSPPPPLSPPPIRSPSSTADLLLDPRRPSSPLASSPLLSPSLTAHCAAPQTDLGASPPLLSPSNLEIGQGVRLVALEVLARARDALQECERMVPQVTE